MVLPSTNNCQQIRTFKIMLQKDISDADISNKNGIHAHGFLHERKKVIFHKHLNSYFMKNQSFCPVNINIRHGTKNNIS